MSLREKLTIGFSFFIGGILLVLGLFIFWIVRIILVDNIDQRLITSSRVLIEKITISGNNSINTRGLVDISSRDNQIFQIWLNSTDLVFSKPIGLNTSIDPIGLYEGEAVFRSVLVGEDRFRVLSVPIITNRGLSGVLQVGIDMGIVELTNQTLAWVLVITLAIGMIISAMVTNIVVKRNLGTLINVTNAAKEITETNDLSRRIPKQIQSSQEIDLIVDSFNDTLEQLDNLLTSQKRLLADVSHELRTPLTVIKGEVGFIRKYKQVDEEAINAIEAEVERLTRLVGNILMLAQAESGDLPMEFSSFQLDELVCEVFHHMRTLSAGRVEVCLENLDQVEVFADRDRIKQVLLNLVGNAIQYTRDQGKVCVGLFSDSDFVQLVIQDNGPGINKEDLKNIFDRFFRGEKSRNRSKSSGFGLGLSISKFIVDQHHGEILVESEIGKGTVFKVLLPRKY